MKTLAHLGICIVFLSLAGCIKDPPDLPLPNPKPGWLLDKFTYIQTNYSAPIDGPVTAQYYKYLHEFEYDGHYKPRLHKVYYGGTDTVNLKLLYIDSLVYDHSLRVKEVISFVPAPRWVRNIKKFFYNGTDSLPAMYEYYDHSRPDTATLALQYKYQYIYEYSAVHQISTGIKGNVDTILFAYPSGNYTHYFGAGGQRTEEYLSYDNAPNVARFLNVSNGLVFEMPLSIRQLPRLSRTNWKEQQAYYSDTRYRTITYNDVGLVNTTEVVAYSDYIPITRYQVRYAYKKVE